MIYWLSVIWINLVFVGVVCVISYWIVLLIREAIYEWPYSKPFVFAIIIIILTVLAFNGAKP